MLGASQRVGLSKSKRPVGSPTSGTSISDQGAVQNISAPKMPTPTKRKSSETSAPSNPSPMKRLQFDDSSNRAGADLPSTILGTNETDVVFGNESNKIMEQAELGVVDRDGTQSTNGDDSIDSGSNIAQRENGSISDDSDEEGKRSEKDKTNLGNQSKADVKKKKKSVNQIQKNIVSLQDLSRKQQPARVHFLSTSESSDCDDIPLINDRRCEKGLIGAPPSWAAVNKGASTSNGKRIGSKEDNNANSKDSNYNVGSSDGESESDDGNKKRGKPKKATSNKKRGKPKKETSKKPPPGTFKCPKCKKEFTAKHGLNGHITNDVCGKKLAKELQKKATTQLDGPSTSRLVTKPRRQRGYHNQYAKKPTREACPPAIGDESTLLDAEADNLFKKVAEKNERIKANEPFANSIAAVMYYAKNFSDVIAIHQDANRVQEHIEDLADSLGRDMYAEVDFGGDDDVTADANGDEEIVLEEEAPDDIDAGIVSVDEYKKRYNKHTSDVQKILKLLANVQSEISKKSFNAERIRFFRNQIKSQLASITGKQSISDEFIKSINEFAWTRLKHSTRRQSIKRLKYWIRFVSAQKDAKLDEFNKETIQEYFKYLSTIKTTTGNVLRVGKALEPSTVFGIIVSTFMALQLIGLIAADADLSTHMPSNQSRLFHAFKDRVQAVNPVEYYALYPPDVADYIRKLDLRSESSIQAAAYVSLRSATMLRRTSILRIDPYHSPGLKVEDVRFFKEPSPLVPGKLVLSAEVTVKFFKDKKESAAVGYGGRKIRLTGFEDGAVDPVKFLFHHMLYLGVFDKSTAEMMKDNKFPYKTGYETKPLFRATTSIDTLSERPLIDDQRIMDDFAEKMGLPAHRVRGHGFRKGSIAFIFEDLLRRQAAGESSTSITTAVKSTNVWGGRGGHGRYVIDCWAGRTDLTRLLFRGEDAPVCAKNAVERRHAVYGLTEDEFVTKDDPVVRRAVAMDETLKPYEERHLKATQDRRNVYHGLGIDPDEPIAKQADKDVYSELSESDRKTIIDADAKRMLYRNSENKHRSILAVAYASYANELRLKAKRDDNLPSAANIEKTFLAFKDFEASCAAIEQHLRRAAKYPYGPFPNVKDCNNGLSRCYFPECDANTLNMTAREFLHHLFVVHDGVAPYLHHGRSKATPDVPRLQQPGTSASIDTTPKPTLAKTKAHFRQVDEEAARQPDAVYLICCGKERPTQGPGKLPQPCEGRKFFTLTLLTTHYRRNHHEHAYCQCTETVCNGKSFRYNEGKLRDHDNLNPPHRVILLPMPFVNYRNDDDGLMSVSKLTENNDQYETARPPSDIVDEVVQTTTNEPGGNGDCQAAAAGGSDKSGYASPMPALTDLPKVSRSESMNSQPVHRATDGKLGCSECDQLRTNNNVVETCVCQMQQVLSAIEETTLQCIALKQVVADRIAAGRNKTEVSLSQEAAFTSIEMSVWNVARRLFPRQFTNASAMEFVEKNCPCVLTLLKSRSPN